MFATVFPDFCPTGREVSFSKWLFCSPLSPIRQNPDAEDRFRRKWIFIALFYPPNSFIWLWLALGWLWARFSLQNGQRCPHRNFNRCPVKSEKGGQNRINGTGRLQAQKKIPLILNVPKGTAFFNFII